MDSGVSDSFLCDFELSFRSPVGVKVDGGDCIESCSDLFFLCFLDSPVSIDFSAVEGEDVDVVGAVRLVMDQIFSLVDPDVSFLFFFHALLFHLVLYVLEEL